MFIGKPCFKAAFHLLMVDLLTYTISNLPPTCLRSITVVLDDYFPLPAFLRGNDKYFLYIAALSTPRIRSW